MKNYEFVLKHYKKGASIQLKPKEDISTDPARCVHFSIAWFSGEPRAPALTKDVLRGITSKIYKDLCDYLEKANWKLQFKISKACENCTYGHFDEGFEKIILDARSMYPLSTEKNLPLALHPELPQEIPIIFHIAHSRSTDADLNAFLKKPGETLNISVTALEVNK